MHATRETQKVPKQHATTCESVASQQELGRGEKEQQQTTEQKQKQTESKGGGVAPACHAPLPSNVCFHVLPTKLPQTFLHECSHSRTEHPLIKLPLLRDSSACCDWPRALVRELASFSSSPSSDSQARPVPRALRWLLRFRAGSCIAP